MTESIFERVARIISGRVEDTVDSMEKSGGTSVMREAIRDVERAIEDVKQSRDTVTVRRLQAVRQQKLFTDRLEELTEKAELALEQGREDLAEAALSRQVDFEAQILNIAKTENAAGEEERKLQENLAALELRSARMTEELQAYEESRVELGLDKTTGECQTRTSEKKIERAEAAFKRAMAGSGGSDGFMPVDVDNFKKMGELNELHRSTIIEDRLEALKNRKKAG